MKTTISYHLYSSGSNNNYLRLWTRVDINDIVLSCDEKHFYLEEELDKVNLLLTTTGQSPVKLRTKVSIKWSKVFEGE